jgi:hypothetical protein
MIYGPGKEVTLKKVWVELQVLIAEIEKSPGFSAGHPSGDYAKQAEAIYRAINDSGRQVLCDRLRLIRDMLSEVIPLDCPSHTPLRRDLDGEEWFDRSGGN